MTMKRVIYNGLPQNIKTILLISEGWIVGKACENLIDMMPPKDYDIIVPSRELFQIVCKHLSAYGKPEINSFGGLKFDMMGYDVDIWCEELDHYLRNASYLGYAYNFKKSIMIGNESKFEVNNT
jgi:hypothetical protein